MSVQAQESGQGSRTKDSGDGDAGAGKAALGVAVTVEVDGQGIGGAVADDTHAEERGLEVVGVASDGGGLHFDGVGAGGAEGGAILGCDGDAVE